MLRTAIVPLALLLTAGCKTVSEPEPRVETQDVVVAVAGPCVPATLGAAPDYPDSDEALRAADPAGRYQLLRAGRELRTARLGELEPVVEGCKHK